MNRSLLILAAVSLLGVGCVFSDPFGFFGYKKFVDTNCHYSFAYPDTWRVGQPKVADDGCSQEVRIKAEPEDCGWNGCSNDFDYYPQERFQITSHSKGFPIDWYGDCYRQFAILREKSVEEAFAWKKKNCPTIQAKTIDDIVKTLGQPTIRKTSDGVETILYDTGPSPDKDSAFYGWEHFNYFAQKGDMIANIQSPVMWPRIIKGGKKIYQSFAFLP